MANWPSWLPIKSAIADSKVYGAPQIQEVIKLNTNENPFKIPEIVVNAITEEIQKVATNLNRYPDRDANELRESLAKYVKADDFGLGVENLWAANGSNEILQQLFLAFASKSAIGLSPSYSVHPLIAKITGSEWIPIELKTDFSIDIGAVISEIKSKNPSLVFITTPNNPTGRVVPFVEIQELASQIRNQKTLLVVDEAYAEFSNEKTAINLINENPQVVVVRTMSKAFAFAGARLGYLIANSVVIDALKVVRLPYHLSSLTQAASLVALRHSKLMQSEIDLIIAERNRLTDNLKSLQLDVVESGSNFLFFSGFGISSSEFWQKLLDKGVLIRDVGVPGYLRVTIGSKSENDEFLKQVKSILR
jgi:histidinol-phosphate aminotransferase